MAKEVTLQQLQDWIEKNEHRTWFWDGPTPCDDRTLEIKYLRFSLDTRDMKIFTVSIEGAGPNRFADFRDDDKDWTILDLLESRLEPKK